MDRISSLPDEVLSHILSFFPIKESARTSVLSKRWRILFAFLPNLDLSEDDYSQSFVDRVLAVSGNSPIKKFSLSCTKASSEPTRFNRWIRDVLNRGVLDLDLSTKAEDWYVLPCEVFTCKTIKKLKLSGFLIAALPENAFLPSLESIILKSVRFCSFKGCAFAKLLSACPVLEELVILDLNWEQWLWSRKITSRSLQRLTIKRRQFRGFNLLYSGSITFDTPSVTHLDYYDYASRSFATVNLDSLVEANLDLFVRVDHRRTWNPTNLIKGLRNIELLNLVSLESLEMFYLFREAIPVFENLVHLSITTAFNYCWRGLPIMLNKSPNLETLTIKGTLHCDPIDCECLSGYSFVLSCPVKVLKIAEYMGTIGEVEKLKHFLGKLSCLELLEVEIQGTDIEDKFEITKGLLMLPRASSKCKIKVK